MHDENWLEQQRFALAREKGRQRLQEIAHRAKARARERARAARANGAAGFAHLSPSTIARMKVRARSLTSPIGRELGIKAVVPADAGARETPPASLPFVSFIHQDG